MIKNFPSDEELIDEEEIDYDDEEDLGSEEEEEVSDIDDTDLMKRLEAKYGKISGENSEDDDDPDADWTSNLGDKLLTNFINFSTLLRFRFLNFMLHSFHFYVVIN